MRAASVGKHGLAGQLPGMHHVQRRMLTFGERGGEVQYQSLQVAGLIVKRINRGKHPMVGQVRLPPGSIQTGQGHLRNRCMSVLPNSDGASPLSCCCHLHYQVMGIALHGTHHLDERYSGRYRGVNGNAAVCIRLCERFQELHALFV